MTLPFIGIVILISGVTLVVAMLGAAAKAEAVATAKAAGQTQVSHSPLALKWREERNAWLAGFNLFAWLALWAHCSAVSALNGGTVGRARGRGDQGHAHQE